MGKPELADPLPERRLARLLGAFLGTGLVFLVAPGTLLGVWNLIGISSQHSAASVSPVWLQAHGHAQLFGWVGSFMIGISLYSVPKFRGGAIRSLGLGWIMWAVWTTALAARWSSAIFEWGWRVLWPAASAAELLVAGLVVYQCAVPGRNRGLWNHLIFTGLAGLVATLAWQVVALYPLPAEPLMAEPRDRILLWLALWIFAFPVAWGFSTRFLPAFLGLRRTRASAVNAGLALLAAAALASLAGMRVGAFLVVGAVLAACRSLGIFERPSKGSKAKTLGVARQYPWFVRAAFGWLVVSALLACAGDSRGWTGASRHAFTVGFLATLIFAMGPRILPSFVNSRELWSKPLMLAALVLLTAGCTLRVASEPLAYGGALPAAWSVLPVSAMLELAGVMAFALNLGMTLALPFPAWLEPQSITADLPVYWYISAYPRTRGILARAGLISLAARGEVPRGLSLRDAAAADQADEQRLLAALRGYFERRLARVLRDKRRV